MYNPKIWDCRTGFSRVELFLPVLLSEGVNKNRISIERLVQVSCEIVNVGSPARIAVTDRWEKSDFDRPGFSKETLRYTEIKNT